MSSRNLIPEDQEAVCVWLERNGIDPDTVSISGIKSYVWPVLVYEEFKTEPGTSIRYVEPGTNEIAKKKRIAFVWRSPSPKARRWLDDAIRDNRE